MPLQKITKGEIIEKAIAVFHQKGYHHSSMKDLAEACGLFKGSFYHYFNSKEALMKEALEVVYQHNKEKIFSIAYQEDLSPKERLEKLLQKQGEIIISEEKGCLFGNMTLETVGLIPEFKDILQAFFTDWIQAFTYIYLSKYDEETAYKLAQQAGMEIEGAIMLMRVFKNPSLLYEACERAIARL